MSSEVLYVPESLLSEVIEVIRAGLTTIVVSDKVRECLTKWCDEEEAYLKEGSA